MVQLTHMEQETIAEVGNISLGAAATALSQIIDRRVDITTPHIKILTVDEVKNSYPVPCLLVETSYTSGLKGDNLLLIKQEDALVIAGIMMGSLAGSTLGEMELSAIQEAMNQMMGYMATSMSDMFGRVIEITPPRLTVCDLAKHNLNRLPKEELVAQVSFSIRVEGAIDSKLIQVIPLDFAKEMAVFLLSEGKKGMESAPSGEQEEDIKAGATGFSPAIGQKPGRFLAAGEEGESGEWEKLDIVREIPLEVTVILGKTRLPLGNLFALDQGGVIYLEQFAGEPVEILINNKLIALGEVVLVNDQFGVRITRQISTH